MPEEKAKKKAEKIIKIIKFTEQEISDMRGMVEEKELIEEDELRELIKKSKKMLIDSTLLAKIFLECYNNLYVNQHLFKNEDKNYTEKLKEYLDSFDIKELRDELEEFGDGEDLGSGYVSGRIKKIVDKDREKIKGLVLFSLILFSLKIFGEEE